jgi:hypothetical protein
MDKEDSNSVALPAKNQMCSMFLNDSGSYVMMELTVGNFKRFSNSNVFVN